ncbi:POLQ [Lepeophtheirus salmonis]|uniref:DNA-directed DNA polymerase n=1 Tax=Lepeophtheirus salmonis TaxID=72036 RepID=A0A7R8HCS1_LEPSM|nr:POLQ [Lepeophtheirus salmonis]CAF3015988.1 POLQ [Lepeophtheirus salmonis]
MGLVIDGVSFSWDLNSDTYFLSLNSNHSNPNDTICPPTQDSRISILERLELLRNIFSNLKHFVSFDIKDQLKVLFLGTGIWLKTNGETIIKDPKVASWLLNPGGKEKKTLSSLIMEFSPMFAPILNTIGSHKGSGSISLFKESTNSSRSRSLTEVLLSKHLMLDMEKVIISNGLQKSFIEVEMPAILSFLAMELNGVGFSEEESILQKDLIIKRMEELEKMAYKLAGRNFSLTSSDDLIKILYFELKLPPNGTNISARKAVLSTNKETLIKLKKYHKLPEIILEWRKLNASVTRVVFPMQRAKSRHKGLEMDRIYTIVLTNTSTGRISLVEPNIQNIPKDFEIDIKNSSFHEHSFRMSSDKTLESVAQFLNSDVSSHETYKVSMRHSIIASQDSLIIAADYSQLELRILAHLLIGSKWKRKDATEITDNERQEAKKMCYGILYGIGCKALGEQLEVTEEEASIFMSDFKDTFPQIRSFIDTTIRNCREKGFVQTMTGRRRYLPNISASKGDPSASYIISHAERQAVNTTIQGSAADLVKMAMININSNLTQLYMDYTAPLRAEAHRTPLKGGFFILQIHDELLYEVASKCVSDVARIIKNGMEKTCKLSVATPVNIKSRTLLGHLANVIHFK